MNGYDGDKDGLLFFEMANCHPAVTPPSLSVSLIYSIAIHPSEPSAPAAITQYLCGAEDKQVLYAGSRHLLPLIHLSWLTVQLIYQDNV